VSVGLAPYAILAALYAVFMIGYVPGVICFLCSGGERQDAADRLITTSASAIVSLLTLTPLECGADRGRREPAGTDCESCHKGGQAPLGQA
jgi:hypothetical protein